MDSAPKFTANYGYEFGMLSVDILCTNILWNSSEWFYKACVELLWKLT
jgi:hypothetical protein